MHARYKKEQKLQRWNESPVAVPPEYKNKLLEIKENNGLGMDLADAIEKYVGAKSVFTRIELLKSVIKALNAAQCHQDPNNFRSSLKAFGELLFVEHAKQMHKAILSSMKSFPGLNECMVDLIRAAIARREQNSSAASKESGPPVACLLACPAADDWMRVVASEACLYVCKRIEAIFKMPNILATQLEEAQDGVSSIYTMVQRYGAHMVKVDGQKGETAIKLVGTTMMQLLQRDSLAREAMASAGVALFSAACLPGVSPKNLVFALAEGLFFCPSSPLDGNPIPPPGYSDRQLGFVEQEFASQGTSLNKEIERLSDFGRLGAIRALVSGSSFEVLCHPLALENSSTQSGCLLELALRFLCKELSKPSDSHTRYHILTAVVHCLKSFRTSLQKFGQFLHEREHNPDEGLVDGAQHDIGDELLCISLGDGCDSDTENPEASIQPAFISNADCDLSIGVIWRHLEDPMPHTEQVVFEAFEILLDILTMQEALVANTNDLPHQDELMEGIARRLLAFSDSKKGKFTSLSALVRRVGAKSLLNYVPDLIDQVFRAFRESSVCRAASLFLKNLLNDLLMESRSEKQDAHSGEAVWRGYWSRALLNGLMDDSEKVRINVTTYVVPAILELDEMSLVHLVHKLLDSDKKHAARGESMSSARLGALLALLRVGRKLNLLPSLDAIVDNPQCVLNVPFSALKRAIFHESEDLHVNALELACIHPKGTLLPDATDLEIVLHAVRVGGRSTRQNIRHKFVTLVGNFLKRMLVALNAKLVGKTQRIEYRNGGRSKDRSKTTPLVASAIMSSCHSEGNWIDPDDQDAETRAIRRSEAFMQEFTKICLLYLYPGAPFQRKVMAIDLLSTVLSQWSKETWVATPLCGAASNGIEVKFQPFCPGFLGSGTIKILLGAAVDSWDQLRAGAVDCLMHFPAPFAGLDTAEKIESLLSWTCQLIRSPRLRESDSGARLLILIFRKYACGLGWEMECHPSVTVSEKPENADRGFEASLKFLRSLCSWLETNVAKGKEDLLAQCEESFAHGAVMTLRYAIEAVYWASLSQHQAQLVRAFVDRLLAVLKQGAELCLTILANQMMASMGAEDIDMEDEFLEEEGENEEACNALGPTARILSTGTWLTMKEISALLGKMARVLPIEGEGIDGDHAILTDSHLDIIGGHFMAALIHMKHNGAVDKTGAGFQELCERLLRCADQEKQRLPSKWMDALFSRILEKGQSRDDIVRRSGGLPFALDAIFSAEPHNCPKVLLPRALRRLLDISTDRDQEQWTRTHALNCLRHVFNDKALAMDASGFFAEGVCVCVAGLSDACWEVRNAAALCFTALTTRMVGYKNVAASGAARKSISAFEFFERYPSLHAFLQENLQSATQELLSTLTKVPPSLAPVLLLLARLLPSMRPHAINASTAVPSHLIPVVRRCTGTPHMAVRILAARSLVPLVSSDDLSSFLMTVMEQVPLQGDGLQDSNLVHGNLLVLRTLLAFTDSVPFGSKVRPDLLKGLGERIWLLCQPKIACGLRLEYVRILMVVFSEGGGDAGEDLTELGSKVRPLLDKVIEMAGTWSQINDPMTALWLKECTRLRYGPIACYGPPLWADKSLLQSALASPVYEVQVAVLKSLSRNSILSNVDCPKEMLLWLRENLVELLQTVTYPKVLRRVLELLTRVLDIMLSWDSADHTIQKPQTEWALASRILASDMGPFNVRISALQCSGRAGRRLLEMKEQKPDAVMDIVEQFAEYLAQWSQPQCSINSRLAAVDVVKASEILAVPADAGGDHLLGVWFSALELLEDEEHVVREHCAGVIAEHLDFSDEMLGCTGGLHAEVVLREAIKSLVDKFGCNKKLIGRMLDWVIDPSKTHEVGIRQPSPTGVSVPVPGMVRKVFDKELDNDHQEVLLRSQLAACHIAKLLTNTTHEIKPLSQAWLEGVVVHLGCLVDEIISFGNVDWVGGATNHPHFFVPMYRALLGLWLGAGILKANDTVGTTLLEIVEKAVEGGVRLHSILGNMLGCVLGKLEMFGGRASVVEVILEDQLDPNFDPMFLTKL